MSIRPHGDHVHVTATLVGRRPRKMESISRSSIDKHGVHTTQSFQGPVLGRTHTVRVDVPWDDVFALVKHMAKQGDMMGKLKEILPLILPDLLKVLTERLSKELLVLAELLIKRITAELTESGPLSTDGCT